MKTAPKPTTPLPWTAFTDRIHHGIWGDSKNVLVTKVRQCEGPRGSTSQDAAYIVHAANAYPKLVEALRDAMLGPRCACNGSGKTRIRGGGAQRGGTEADCSCVPFRALLLELGEAS